MIKPVILACLLPVLTPLVVWKWCKMSPQTLTVCRDHVLEAPNHCEDGARSGALAQPQFSNGDAYIVCVCPGSTGVVYWK